MLIDQGAFIYYIMQKIDFSDLLLSLSKIFHKEKFPLFELLRNFIPSLRYVITERTISKVHFEIYEKCENLNWKILIILLWKSKNFPNPVIPFMFLKNVSKIEYILTSFKKRIHVKITYLFLEAFNSKFLSFQKTKYLENSPQIL